MQAIVKQRPDRGIAHVLHAPEPAIGERDVLVAVEATSLCGTDLELFEWSASAQAFSPRLPLVMGHECAGTVTAVGDAVEHVAVGDRVALESHLYCGACRLCRGGNAHNCLNMRILGLTWDGAFAEYVAVPAAACFPVPETVPLDVAALFEPAGVAVHALQRAGSVAGCAVAVAGCGPIGLLVVRLAQLFGATAVVAVEPNPFRRRLAREFGADAVDPAETTIEQACARVQPGGVDVAFETSGAAAVLPDLLRAVRREGRVVTVGHPAQPEAIDVAAHINKQGVVLAGVFGRRIWDTWQLLAALVESGRLDLSAFITHRLDLAQFEHGLQLLRGDAAKVLVHPR